ncbi:MAG: hypothetical protein D6780_00425 [Candidatus Dadabacteria bacterium]|nr:MAG: hypothetical protein D6780_00425 [Candidatus Dadabacteria bacterium]
MILSGTYTAAAATRISAKFEVRKLSTTEVIGCVIILFQILDALFTNLGMLRFGTSAEGNALLRSLMELFGVAPTLSIAKSAAVVGVWLAIGLEKKVNSLFVKVLFGGVALLYGLLAVLPWAVILFFS